MPCKCGGGGGGSRPRPPDPAPEPSPVPDPVNPNPAVTGTEDLVQLLAAEIGRPIPLAFGRHLVGGKPFFEHEVQTGADKGKTLLFVALGVGEWDSIEALFVNGKLVDHTDTSQFHFHPGKAGEGGNETDPATPNQKICSFWLSGFAVQPNFPGIVYLAMKLAPDIEAPGPGFQVIGIYKTLLVRIFDNVGNQTSYAFSSNTAWISLDNHIRSWIAPTKTNGETLSAAEKDEIDFQAFKDWADDCDFVTPQSTKRFESHYALTEETDLMRALELDHLLGRAYTLERNAKITPFMDKVRSPVATVKAAHIAEGSFNLGRRSLRDAANRIEVKYRDLDSGKGAGTLSTTGVTVTGIGTKFTELYKPGEPSELDDGAQAGEVRAVKSVASDTSMVLESAYSTDQSGRAHRNPAQDFQVKTFVKEDTTLQGQVGRVITATFDLGNSTPERAERIATFLLDRTTKLIRLTGYRLLLGQATALDHLAGDVLTSPDDVGFDPANTRDFEALEVTVQPDGSVEIAGQEYQNIFSDAAAAAPAQVVGLAPRPRTGVAGGFQMGAVFAPDQLNGASNAGEIDFDPLPNQDQTFWRLPDGTLLTFPAGSQFVSQATLDSYTGDVFLIFSEQLCNSERGLAAFQDSHLLEVRHNAGQWQYDNNSAWVNFTPVASDIAIFRATRSGANWAGVPMEYLGVSLLSQRVLSTLVEYADGTPIDNLQPAEAGAEVTTGKSLTVLTDRELDNISDSVTRFAAVEAGANKTETRTAAAISGQGALATKSAVDLATAEVTNKTAANIAETGARKWLPDLLRIFTNSTKKTNVEGLENNGDLKAGKFNAANFGIKALASNLITSSRTSPPTGWVAYPITRSIDVPDETASITLEMVLPSQSSSGSRSIVIPGADNIGFSITSGAGP
ncbi:hypothetical protein LCGC14_1767590, partial [marine sediment metagenome]